MRKNKSVEKRIEHKTSYRGSPLNLRVHLSKPKDTSTPLTPSEGFFPLCKESLLQRNLNPKGPLTIFLYTPR